MALLMRSRRIRQLCLIFERNKAIKERRHFTFLDVRSYHVLSVHCFQLSFVWLITILDDEKTGRELGLNDKIAAWWGGLNKYTLFNLLVHRILFQLNLLQVQIVRGSTAIFLLECLWSEKGWRLCYKRFLTSFLSRPPRLSYCNRFVFLEPARLLDFFNFK